MSVGQPHARFQRRYGFIFVSDQGSVCGSVTPPTKEDLRLAGVGILTVVDLRTSRYYGREECWLPVLPGQLAAPLIDGEPVEPFHALQTE